MNEETMAMTPEGLLRVGTRDGDANNVNDGRIYVMDQAGSCVSVLSVSASEPEVTKGLPKGTYDLYALGGDDLSCLTLPEASAAKANSVIPQAEDKALGDVLWGHAQVTLNRNDTKDIDIQMERKVVCITGISVQEVPAEVTKVSVSLTPMNVALLLNGKYDALFKTVTILLTKHDTTWETEQAVYSFPSRGRTAITISIKTSEGEKHYSYVTSEEGLPANKQVQISATYSEAWAATLNASLTYTAWGEQKAIDFAFNEDNAGNKKEDGDKTVPTVGQNFDGYYVVSVDAANRKAVLLRKVQGNNIESQSGMESAFAELTKKPEGATGGWRLPTPAECDVFALDATLPLRAFDHGYYCQDGETVKSYDIAVINGILKHTGMTEGYSAETWFRPVIDVTY